MPTVINGIGTRHWGKRNEFVERDACENCGTVGDLSSFDTNLCFVALFYPLVPFRTERVLRKCPKCGRFSVAPYKEWTRDRDTNLKAALAELKANPKDTELAKKTIGLTMAYQYEAAFNRLVNMMGTHFDGDAEVQLALGAAYGYFNRHAEAEDFLRRARKLQDNAETRTALAANLIRTGKPDEAAPLLDFLYTKPDPERAGYLFLLAEGYEAGGRHDDALRQYRRLEEAYPEITERDKTFREARARAEKNAGTHRKVVSPDLKPLRKPTGSGADFNYYFPRFSGLLLVALVVGLYFYSNISTGLSRKLYVVNGLDVPYTVQIEDERQLIKPYSHAVFTVAEGTQTYTVEGEGVALPPGEFHWETDFATRFLDTDVYVLNPDRTAILVRESLEYAHGSIPGSDLADPKYQYSTGELLSRYSNIHIPFRNMPDEVELPKGTMRTWKTGLNVMTGGSVRSSYEFLKGKEIDPMPYLRHWNAAQPQRKDVMRALFSLLPPGEFIELARPRVEQEPLDIEWHRLYQEARETNGEKKEMIAEYEKLLAEDPDDPLRQYLLGRVVTDETRAVGLFQKATGAEDPPPRAFSAMAYHYLMRGDFAQALPYAEKAHGLDENFYMYLQEAKAGSEDWDWLQGQSRKYFEKSPSNLGLGADIVRYLTLQGQEDEVPAFINDYIELNQHELSAQGKENVTTFLNAHHAYTRGDTARFAEIGEGFGSPGWLFTAAVSKGQYARALQLLPEADYNIYEMTLLLYALAKQTGNEEVATTCLQDLATYAMDGDELSAEALKLINADTPPTVREMEKVEFMPDNKKYLMLAVMAKFPEQRAAYLPLARKLNYWRNFPYNTVQDFLDGKLKPAPED